VFLPSLLSRLFQTYTVSHPAMTVVSYHSTLINKDLASKEEAADKTSSQIFLSRGVAGAEARTAASASAPRTPSPTFVMSVFESESRHVMSLGNAAAKTISSGTGAETGLCEVLQDSGEGMISPMISPASAEMSFADCHRS